MGFPYRNAKTNTNLVVGVYHTTIIAKLQLISGVYNLFSTPGIVDVTAMEISIGMLWNAEAAQGRSTSGNAGYDTALVDGGPTGDGTGPVLFTVLGGTDGVNLTQFASTIPFDVAGTSTTDLDADDWVNVKHGTSLTTTSAFGVQEVTVGYLVGKPAGIA